ncbi:hypothetical protein EW026_g1702 [Hermanssonia centrifuga]|uniref:DH domain-containing protein n=1 Tax=Hermanssonia centrifuga TaxID=98765 RepID=A0A4V3XB72_9APHY|nr:hypothetical protein EW026_g1702 [Hermanssonia centrifuga]
MTTAAGRKKSIISTIGPSIDIPVPNNTLLNKAASQSTSLYQQCSVLRTRLMRVQGFALFFNVQPELEPSSSRRSTDPVTQLWDCLALGVPLCHLFNLLPSVTPLAVETISVDLTNDRIKKRAIAQFAMGLRQLEGCATFTVTDLWDRSSTDGFVKVVNIVTFVVDHLPETVFEEAVPSSPVPFSPNESNVSPPSDSVASTPQEYPGSNVVMELLHTERKYVQDLETMQEEEFAVYEPYCANYTTASEIMLQEEHHLTALDDILNVKSELPAFLIKPVQRICKYPLLLDSLVKVLTGKNEYSHLEQLKSGVAAAKRITDKINEEQRRAENLGTVKNLEGRVEDWKGHHISNFGTLLLDDIFTVTKSDMDREYHVFLFEKIILCCKEYIPTGPNGKKVNKSNSILKKPGAPPALNIPGGASSKKKNTPLLLKGRIFLNNVTSASPKINQGQYSLAVYWKGDDDLEYFTLRCRNEEQLRQWENQLNRLIQEVAARRTSEGRNPHMRFTHVAPNSTSPAPSGRQTPYGQGNDRTFSMFSQATSVSSSLPSHPAPYGNRNTRDIHLMKASTSMEKGTMNMKITL